MKPQPECAWCTYGEPLLLPIQTSSIQFIFQHGHEKTPEGLLWWLTCLWCNYTSCCSPYEVWTVYFCEQICSEESDTLFVNFEVFHSVHFCILDVSGHLGWCAWRHVFLWSPAELQWWSSLHGFYCVLNISVKCICWGLKLQFARNVLVLSCVKFVAFRFLNCLSSLSSL
jgi:hypothetical protein